MQLLKVGAAVLNQTPLAWDSNKTHILAAIDEARRQRVSLLCLPELCITGYGCEDAFLSRGVQRTARRRARGNSAGHARNRRFARLAAALWQRALQHGLPGGRSADSGVCRQAVSGRRWDPLRAALVQAVAARAAGGGDDWRPRVSAGRYRFRRRRDQDRLRDLRRRVGRQSAGQRIGAAAASM